MGTDANKECSLDDETLVMVPSDVGETRRPLTVHRDSLRRDKPGYHSYLRAITVFPEADLKGDSVDTN